MMKRFLPTLVFGVISTLAFVGANACGGGDSVSGSNGGSGGSAMSSSRGSGGTSAGGSNEGGGGSSGTKISSTASGNGGENDPGDVGVWQDGPGSCPAGMPKKDVTTSDELAGATRGEDPPWKSDAPATCYFVHDGSYQQDPVVFYALKGGDAGGKNRIFVGESRDGVVIHGRGTIEDGVHDITVTNMTFDLTSYQGSDAFNTLSVQKVKNVTIDHVTFTGDCQTGAEGGHIETNGADGVLVEACLIEKFGRCNQDVGHEDHGVYLASGKSIVLRNNVIRQNSSRGIQMYTQGGEYGTLDQVTVENNLVQENGHRDQEDGIVINSYKTGPISNVTIQRNIFLKNYFSGIRFAGGKESAIVVRDNTFVENGAGSNAAGRSEINVDDPGGNTGTSIVSNLFEVGNLLINDCYQGADNGFSFGANFVHGAIPTGITANCVGKQTLGDPMFAGASDFHPTNAAAKAYGAYAP